MQNLGYYNGQIDLIENIKVPMTDRGFYFGDGLYDVAYARNHVIYALDEHLNRFYSGMELLEMRPPMPQEQLRELLCHLVLKVDDGEQLVYWQATRGCGLRTHAFEDEGKPSNLAIMLRPASIRPVYTPVRLITAEDRRHQYCNVKTLSLLPGIMTAQMAARAGADETVLLRDDRVTECSHSNISMLKDGVFVTPPADRFMLAGVGRAHLMAACHELGIDVVERTFTLGELLDADEIILSSAGSLCLSAFELDGRPVGGKAPELLKKLQDFVVADWLKKTE